MHPHIIILMAFIGEVITPSRKTTQPEVTDNKDGTIILKFDPSEEGLHQLLIKSTGNDLPGQTSHILSGKHLQQTIYRNVSLLTLQIYGLNKILFSSCSTSTAVLCK